MDFIVEQAAIVWEKFICGYMKLSNGAALELLGSSVKGWSILGGFR